MERFARLVQLVGHEGLARLAAAEVAVFGLGAVGFYTVEALARAGVGRLRLVDFDTIQPSNLNRQLLALTSTVGRPKIALARQRVLDINPACEVTLHDVFANAQTLPDLLTPLPDAVIDAIDGVNAKVNLLAEAHGRGLLTVSSMGAGGRLDPSLIRSADLSATEVCPLARFVRRRLRRRGIHSGIRCIYSIEPAASQAEGLDPEETDPEKGRPRTPIGSISFIPGIFGLWAAAEVVQYILTKDGP